MSISELTWLGSPFRILVPVHTKSSFSTVKAPPSACCFRISWILIPHSVFIAQHCPSDISSHKLTLSDLCHPHSSCGLMQPSEGGETTGSQLCSFPNGLHQSRVYARTLGRLLSPRLLITLICLMMPSIQCLEFLWGDNGNLHLCQALEFATALADHNLMRFSQQSHGGYYRSFNRQWNRFV